MINETIKQITQTGRANEEPDDWDDDGVDDDDEPESGGNGDGDGCWVLFEADEFSNELIW